MSLITNDSLAARAAFLVAVVVAVDMTVAALVFPDAKVVAAQETWTAAIMLEGATSLVRFSPEPVPLQHFMK